jgi:hypothetical protein
LVFVSDEVEQYFEYVNTLKYDEMPDYNKLRKLFQDGLRKRKFTNDGQTVTFRTADSASSSNEEAMDNPDEMVGKTGFFWSTKTRKKRMSLLSLGRK